MHPHFLQSLPCLHVNSAKNSGLLCLTRRGDQHWAGYQAPTTSVRLSRYLPLIVNPRELQNDHRRRLVVRNSPIYAVLQVCILPKRNQSRKSEEEIYDPTISCREVP